MLEKETLRVNLKLVIFTIIYLLRQMCSEITDRLRDGKSAVNNFCTIVMR